MSNKTVAQRRVYAFTLVELLVVIGIIAILISTLLPVLSNARKAADKAKCLASLHQMGDAYKMYAGENKGAWPVSVLFWSSKGVQRDKRYHDFIAKYIMGSQSVTDPATGKVYTDTNMNFNGSCSSTTLGGIAAYQTHGPFGTVEDPIWMGTLRDKNSILWGCPSWSKFGFSAQYDYGINNGYAMNFFPQAPLDEVASGNGVDVSKCARIIDAGSPLRFGDTASTAGSNFAGNFYKSTAYSRGAERALIYESVFNAGYLAPLAWNQGSGSVTITGTTFNPTDPTALLPTVGDSTVSLDWNRHTKAKVGNVHNSDIAMNVLFCDGHAATVSTREAYKAIRFH